MSVDSFEMRPTLLVVILGAKTGGIRNLGGQFPYR